MLTCQQLTELVTDYLEGRLSLLERVSFQIHIGMCRGCRAYLRQMKMTVRTLGKVPRDPIPEAVRDELLARFRDMRPREGAGAASKPWTLGLLAGIEQAIGGGRGWMVAGVLLAIVLGALFACGLRAGPLGNGGRCVLVELGGGGALVGLLGVLASAHRSRLSSTTFGVVGMVGSLGGFAALQALCEASRVAAHVLVFHVGGIVLAGTMGLLASRLPALR
jgi:anti-sigma factor RsiW